MTLLRCSLLSGLCCVALGCGAAQVATCPEPAPSTPATSSSAAPSAEASDAAGAAAEKPALHAPLQHEAASIVYRPAPPNMPAGVEMAVLEGDPRAEGMFTLRLKAPPGFVLPPHTHPVDERVTVLSGSIAVGFGTSVQREQAKRFGAGSFYVNPPDQAHYVFSDEGVVLQITAMGPWRVEPISAQ